MEYNLERTLRLKQEREKTGFQMDRERAIENEEKDRLTQYLWDLFRREGFVSGNYIHPIEDAEKYLTLSKDQARIQGQTHVFASVIIENYLRSMEPDEEED